MICSAYMVGGNLAKLFKEVRVFPEILPEAQCSHAWTQRDERLASRHQVEEGGFQELCTDE